MAPQGMVGEGCRHACATKPLEGTPVDSGRVWRGVSGREE